jgi:hypothetical protein
MNEIKNCNNFIYPYEFRNKGLSIRGVYVLSQEEEKGCSGFPSQVFKVLRIELSDGTHGYFRSDWFEDVGDELQYPKQITTAILGEHMILPTDIQLLAQFDDQQLADFHAVEKLLYPIEETFNTDQGYAYPLRVTLELN